MMQTKAFPTADVLSTVTGYLVSPNGIWGVYEVLNWMTGENVYTHQLPRIGSEACLMWYERNRDVPSPSGRTVTREERKKWNGREMKWCLDHDFLKVGPSGWHVPSESGLSLLTQAHRPEGKTCDDFSCPICYSQGIEAAEEE